MVNYVIVVVSIIIFVFLSLVGLALYYVHLKNKWKYKFIIHDPDFPKYQFKQACIITDKVNPENKYFKVKDYEAMELPFIAHTSEIDGVRCWDTVKLPTGNLAYCSKRIKMQDGKKLIDYELETVEKEQLTNAYIKKCKNHDEKDPYKLLSMILSIILVLVVCITLIVGWYYQSKIADKFEKASKLQADTVYALMPIYTENTKTLEIIAQNIAQWTGKNYTKNFTRTIETEGIS